VSRKGTDLSKIMGRIHSHSATKIRSATHCELPIWWNYWDYCPRNEKRLLHTTKLFVDESDQT